MYFAFLAEPSSSLSALTPLMATAENGEGRRERKVKARRKEAETRSERNKEES